MENVVTVMEVLVTSMSFSLWRTLTLLYYTHIASLSQRIFVVLSH